MSKVALEYWATYCCMGRGIRYMKKIVDSFAKNGTIFVDFYDIKKDIKTRTSADIYVATSLENRYYFIVKLNKKSAIYSKDFQMLKELENKAAKLCEHNFRYRYLLVDFKLTKQSKEKLKQLRWRYHDSV